MARTSILAALSAGESGLPRSDAAMTLSQVSSATATRSLPGANGVVTAEALRQASLATLQDLFATVVPTVDDLAR